MNKVFFAALAAIGLAFAGCNDQADGLTTNKPGADGKIDFTLRTSIPQGITTYASHNGGATNVDPANYDLRYIVEVWTRDITPALVTRRSQIVDDDFKATEAVFNLHITPGDYDFVLWADFVDQGTTKDKFYKTSASTGQNEADVEASAATVGSGLTEIELLPESGSYPMVCTEARDAFYASKHIDMTTGPQSVSITLTRPFGKFRLISRYILDDFGFNLSDLTAHLEYARSTTSLPAGFNAKTGVVDASKTLTPLAGGYSGTMAKEDVVAGGKIYKDAIVAMFDYVFVPASQIVEFDASVLDAGLSQVAQLQLSNIPVGQNKLTTILVDNIFGGNAATLTVIVDDNFDSESIVDADGNAVTFPYTDNMAHVRGGTFMFGNPNGTDPQESVTLSSFYMGKHEVTQKEYLAVMGSFPDALPNQPTSAKGLGDDYPMYYVSWYDAIEFCNALSLSEGKEEYYSIDKVNQDPGNSASDDNKKWTVTPNPGKKGYRLPTVAEWEFAARGGLHNSDFAFSGSNTCNEVAWNYFNSNDMTHRVELLKPNALGIYDMNGNVQERCWDWTRTGGYSADGKTNPTGPTSGGWRALRGGSYNLLDSQISIYGDTQYVVDWYYNNTGFRIVLDE